jgi:hypothetical protein
MGDWSHPPINKKVLTGVENGFYIRYGYFIKKEGTY